MREKVTKQAILQVSTKIVNQQGFEALTLAKVAKALKIKTPSLYNHLSGLKELRYVLTLDALNQLKHAITSAAVGSSGEKALKAIGLAQIQFMRENPGLYELTISIPDSCDPQIAQVSSEIISIFLRVLEPYHLSEASAIHFVRGLRALSHGFSTLERQGGFNMNIPLEKSIDLAFDTLIRGLIGSLSVNAIQ